jgi:hypothetical protein
MLHQLVGDLWPRVLRSHMAKMRTLYSSRYGRHIADFGPPPPGGYWDHKMRVAPS